MARVLAFRGGEDPTLPSPPRARRDSPFVRTMKRLETVSPRHAAVLERLAAQIVTRAKAGA